MVELMDKRRSIVNAVLICFACLLIDVIAADGEYFFGLVGQLPTWSVVATSTCKADYNVKLLRRLRTVECGILVLMEILHHIGFVSV